MKTLTRISSSAKSNQDHEYYHDYNRTPLIESSVVLVCRLISQLEELVTAASGAKMIYFHNEKEKYNDNRTNNMMLTFGIWADDGLFSVEHGTGLKKL